MNFQKDEVGARKKSDKPTADDSAGNDEFEEDEPQPEPEESASPDDTTTPTRSSKRSTTSSTTQRKGKSSLNADVVGIVISEFGLFVSIVLKIVPCLIN